MKRVYAAIGAFLLAATVTVGTTGWSPLCVLYEPWSFLWIFHACWEAPPNPPEG